MAPGVLFKITRQKETLKKKQANCPKTFLMKTVNIVQGLR